MTRMAYVAERELEREDLTPQARRRYEVGLSIAELARRSFTSPSTVVRYEGNPESVSASSRLRIEAALDLAEPVDPRATGRTLRRVEANLTQSELAYLANVSRKSVVRWQADPDAVSPATRSAIETALKRR